MNAPLLGIKNWDTFQHYGRRNPPWIKLHRAILDDYSFCALPDVSKGHLMLLWLYASQNNGTVPHDVPFLERKLSITNLDIEVLIEHGFLLPPGAAGVKLARGGARVCLTELIGATT